MWVGVSKACLTGSCCCDEAHFGASLPDKHLHLSNCTSGLCAIVWVIDLQPSFSCRDKHNDILMISASFSFSDVIKLLQRDKNTLRNPLCKLWENTHKFMVNFPSSCFLSPVSCLTPALLFSSLVTVAWGCHGTQQGICATTMSVKSLSRS